MLTEDAKDKVNLDNIKEQSLDKPKAKLIEPIKVLKEKIMDLKSEKTEQSGLYIKINHTVFVNMNFFR